MADAAMTVLLETLSHVLLSCSDLISGAEDDLRLLRIEVESFRTFLRSMADKLREEDAFRAMERQVEEVVYDVQDTIDTYLIEPAAARSKIGLFPRCSDPLVASLAERVRFFRENKAKPLLEKAGMNPAFSGPVINRPTAPPSSYLMMNYPFAPCFAYPLCAIAKVLENVSNLLGGDLVSAAGEELRQLFNEVDLMRTFLENAAKMPYAKEPFRELERQIIEAVRYAQDTIDSYAFAAKRKTAPFRRRRDLDAKHVGNLAEVVKSLREDEVKPKFERARIDFGYRMLLIGKRSGKILEEPRQIKVNKVWSTGRDRVIGFEDEQAKITGYLKEKKEELDFLSIIGMAGLGKTTLARQIYQSHEIQYEFPTRIWVYVSKDLNRKDVFVNILKEVSSKDMSTVGDDELISAVHHFLEKRKFLLVLDDVWNPLHFYAILDALPRNNRSSKVLITSRMLYVGRHAMLSIEPHRMRLLRKDECWELLQVEVFGRLHSCPSQLIEIGQNIARKCDGLPLTVVIIAGILVDELSKTRSISALKQAWIEVSEDMNLFNRGGWNFMDFGYNRLSDELRNLCLYLGVFPEDYEIPAATLIRLWIAEGFIRHQEGWSLEDIAEEKLNHLIQRKLVFVDKVRSNGKVKSCHLHDTVRDFCIKKGREVNLFQEITHSTKDDDEDEDEDEDEEEEDQATKTFLVKKQHRRLCIHSDLLEYFFSKRYFPSVRSFLCFYKNETLLLPENTSKIPGNAFELLRVLDIKHIRFTRFPLELTQLFCLRYIVLSSNFKILPEAISVLRNIQTLTIHTSSRILEIKADIWKMVQLRHLQTNASIILHKEPENQSEQKLQRLSNLSPENCTSSVLNRARCLKKLGIRGMLPKLLDGEVGSRKFDHFEKLKDLENLKLLNDVHMVSPSEGRLHCLPPPDKFPAKLRSLTLSATFLSWEHMPVLGMLENLEVLKLKDNAFVGECWEVADGSFPSLQVLQIGYTNLVSWKAARGHFPKLRSLAVRNCEKLEALPQGLEYVLCLQDIELLRPSKAVVVSAREIEEERLQMRGKYPRIKLSIFYPADE